MAKEITMKKLMTSVAAVALFAAVGMSSAGAATRLSDHQMDQVTAGVLVAAAWSDGSAKGYIAVVASDPQAVATQHFAAASDATIAVGNKANVSSGAVAVSAH